MVYLDNAATTKMSSQALNGYLTVSNDEWANPNSTHSLGLSSKEYLNDAIKIICNYINCEANELLFTSGATEGNNMIINNIDKIYKSDYSIVTSKMEHESILKPLENIQGNTLYLKPNKNGIIEPSKLNDLLNNSENVRLVTIQFVNNEIGTIQHIKPLANVCKKHNVLFHTDATQAIGQFKVDVKELGVDFLSASAHKFNGPKGVGFLYVNGDIKNIQNLMFGGHQQSEKRPGTINVAGIYSMAKALENRMLQIDNINYRNEIYSNKIENALSRFDSFHINGNSVNRSKHILNFYIDGLESDFILDELNNLNIYASSGSACSLRYNDFSDTLLSIGYSKWVAQNSVRLSFDPLTNSDSDIDSVIGALITIIKNHV